MNLTKSLEARALPTIAPRIAHFHHQWYETMILFTGGRSNMPTGERRVKIQILIAGLAATLLVVGAAFAAQPLMHVVAAPVLMRKDLIGMPGKEVRVLIVDSSPGASSPVHRHNAQVFVYVLSGKMIMQVMGSSPVTLGPGQTFYEGPEAIHTMSKNASDKEPARFLAFLIMDKGAPVSVPMK